MFTKELFRFARFLRAFPPRFSRRSGHGEPGYVDFFSTAVGSRRKLATAFSNPWLRRLLQVGLFATQRVNSGGNGGGSIDRSGHWWAVVFQMNRRGLERGKSGVFETQRILFLGIQTYVDRGRLRRNTVHTRTRRGPSEHGVPRGEREKERKKSIQALRQLNPRASRAPFLLYMLYSPGFRHRKLKS